MLLGCAGHVANTESIPGDVTHLAWGRAEFDGRWSDFRLVVTGLCSPEHCVSRGRIEWFDGSSLPGTAAVRRVVPVEELESVLLVDAIRFHPMQDAEPASFEIDLVNTYSQEPGRLTLSITGPGTYGAVLVGDPLAADPDQ